jgi:hypothetical protein
MEDTWAAAAAVGGLGECDGCEELNLMNGPLKVRERGRWTLL